MSKENGNIYHKIIRFFKKIFKSKNDNIPLLGEASEITSNVDEKMAFVDSLRINKTEDKKLLEIQRKFEKNNISLLDMSSEEINDINLLYDRQIQDLENELSDKKINLAIMKKNINNA